MLTKKDWGTHRRAALSFVSPLRVLLLVSTAFFLSAFVASAQNGSGIGSWDLKSPADLAFAFDYNDTGVADHIVLYRPGTGNIQIVEKGATSWNTVYASSSGIGGYDLLSPVDRIIPFDYDRKGFVDHLVCYRPGTGIIWILARNGGTFQAVFQSSTGLATYDLLSTSDILSSFDFNGTGVLDCLIAYRPGAGDIQIIQGNGDGTFTTLLESNNGVNGYDLRSTSDLILPFDYYGTGSADHLVMYRPGTGIVWIMENRNGNFVPVFQSQSGIGGYNLEDTRDRLLAYDYSSLGILDHMVAYRPGAGIVWILGSAFFNYSPVYRNPSQGIGSFDLMASEDQGFAFNAGVSGSLPNLVFYRPGTGTIYILNTSANMFAPLYMDAVSAARTGFTVPMNP